MSPVTFNERLETTPFEAELAPNEERTFEVSMGAFDALGLLTASGEFFSAWLGANLGGIEFLVLDAEMASQLKTRRSKELYYQTKSSSGCGLTSAG